MSPRKPSSGEKISRKQEILVRAARLFSERGYHATRMEEIAEACGLTKAALYYYFPDGKAQILLELVRQGWELLAQVPDIPKGISPEETLERLLRHHARVYLSHPELFDVLFREARAIQEIVARVPSARKSLEELRRTYLAPYLSLFQDAVAPERLPHLMRAISGLVYAFLYARRPDPEPDLDHLVYFARRMAFG